MTQPKDLITEYLRALSGRAKTEAVVRRYVTDDALAKHIAGVEAAFPGYEIGIEDLLAGGDKVVVRGIFHGVQRGPFAGIEATAKVVSAGLIIIYQVTNGMIVDHWMQFDLFTLVDQLRSSSEAVAA